MTAEDAPVVFIVDDDANVRRSIRDLLESVALESEAFASPWEVLESQEQARFRYGGRAEHPRRHRLWEVGPAAVVVKGHDRAQPRSWGHRAMNERGG